MRDHTELLDECYATMSHGYNHSTLAVGIMYEKLEQKNITMLKALQQIADPDTTDSSWIKACARSAIESVGGSTPVEEK